MTYTAGLRGLLPTLGLIYGVQAACASVAVPLKTEKYYDLAGSFGFQTAVLFSLWAPSLKARFIEGSKLPLPGITSFHSRQLIMSGLTMFWAARLGTFLFQRIQRSGSDSRFDEIKQSPTKFFGAWMMQATWISLTALPVFLVNSIPSKAQPPLGIKDFLGLSVWLLGMGLEAVADRQKSAWREEKNEKKHDENFIKSGVWSWSRHPNYFGEITLWSGMYLLSTTSLLNAAPYFPAHTVGLALASPVLEYGLIRFVSGVPLLEKSSDKKLKDDPKWKEYKQNVPCFVPFIGSKN